MGASDGIFGYTFILLVLTFRQQQSHSFEIRCPEQSEWSFKAIAKCVNVLEYFCLLDDNVKIYTEFCKRNPDIARDITWKKGQKCVLRGNLDGEVCSTERYQPFKFQTDGNSDCVYRKSNCQEEGMIIYTNDSTTSDTKCRCDHTKGFAFVSKTKQSCYCIPSQQDCSCYKKECKRNYKLSSEYNCIFLDSQDDKSACSSLEKRPLVHDGAQNPNIKKTNTDFSTENVIVTVGKRRMFINLTTTVIIVSILLFSMVFWICCTKVKSCLRNLYVTDTNMEKVHEILAAAESDYQEELEKIHNDKIPQDVREFHDNLIQEWNQNDNMIIVTKAAQSVYNQLKESDCVCLVGRPGSGKSSILRHVALTFVEENETEEFDIIPDVVEPVQCLLYYNERRNQIFILDDFCGRDKKVYSPIISVWKLEIEKILNIINQRDFVGHGIRNVKKTKILISCNISVYESPMFEPLQKHLKPFICKLSEFPLEKAERENMLRKYVPNAQMEKYMCEKEQMQFDFPLLCKLSKGKSIDEIRLLFSNPLQIIKDNLENVKKTEIIQFCSIALCTLFNNEFETKWLNLNCEPDNFHNKNAVSDMFLEFRLDLTNDIDRKLIQEQFDNEHMDWLSKSGKIYHHIHEEIFKIASVICGESYERCFIDNAPSSFIAKRYNFMEKIDGLICPKPKYRKIYFDRLFRDLEEGISYSTFQNIQLTNKRYRLWFFDYCRDRKSKFKELLGNIKSDTSIKAALIRRNTIDFDLKVPLIDCASQGYIHMVDFLLEMNCDVNVIDNCGRSALHVASEQGHFEIVKSLVENIPDGADIASTDNNRKTSLHMACEEGHTYIVEYLINKKADISARDINGCSSLHMACISGKKEIVELLLKTKKEEIYKSDNSGQTPIIIASLHGEEEVVEFLLQFDKEDLNRLKLVHDTDKKGFTPLLASCINGHINTTTLLIDKGSDILHSDNNGRTALFIACEKGQKNIVELLIEKGKHMKKDIIEKSDWHMNAPIYIACAEKRTEIVKLLIDNDAKINKCNEDKKSPLYVACEKGNLTIVELLLKKEADINICDRHKKLPLHVACKRGDLKMVELLYARHEASPFDFKQLRETAKSIAVKQGHIDIAKFLTEHDVDTNNKKVQGNVISD